jgi:hypothetical protein
MSEEQPFSLQPEYPQGGHVVKLMADWSTVKAGAYAGRAFFGTSTNRSREPRVCSCSGGPGTIMTPVSDLRRTGKMRMTRYWRWKTYPKRDGGEEYAELAWIWEWTPGGK